ncbi:uncharacterized protein LOC125573898 [Nematostella vectensis]|uniref:uncharacterized protein LOC125573898 n=1 Tax=Nematostella vectensis TaxID=45351 RepID=UPI0020774F55|nr:uncharacterized protein LOC125573898 [Nematostella vectensis]
MHLFETFFRVMSVKAPRDGVSGFHFDFHKSITCPKITTQDSYYASKLATYGFGIHSGATGITTTYIWPESVASKNPDSLLSCIYYHSTRVEQDNMGWNIFWADNARFQNKNYTVALFLEHLVESGIRRRIDYKFFVSGHSYGAVDRDAGRCEKLIRREEVLECPADYRELINESSLHPKTHWIELDQSNFKNYSTFKEESYFFLSFSLLTIFMQLMLFAISPLHQK